MVRSDEGCGERATTAAPDTGALDNLDGGDRAAGLNGVAFRMEVAGEEFRRATVGATADGDEAAGFGLGRLGVSCRGFTVLAFTLGES